MKPITGRRWRLKEFDADAVDALLQDTGVPALLSRLLVIRGITSAEAAEQFLSPSLAGISDPTPERCCHRLP